MSLVLANRDLRLNYDNAIKMLMAANNVQRNQIDEDQVTQGFIRTEANLQQNTSTIQFSVVDTQQVSQSPITPQMRLLTMQDSFVVGSMSYFQQVYSYSNNQQSQPDYASGRTWQPVTWCSPWVNNSPAQYFDPGCMMLWLGHISLEVDKKVLIPYWDTYRHFMIPQTQATPSYMLPSDLVQFNEIDGSDDSFYPVEPNIVIGGGRGNVLKNNLPSNIPNIAPFNLPNYGVTFIVKNVIMFRGILAQNSTSVK